jgi:hypothetical protein
VSAQPTPQEANATALLVEAQDERARRAYDLRKRGRSWWSIAEELEITEGGAKALVANAISAAAELVSAHTRHQLLAMEIARLDDLTDAHWDQALFDPRIAELMLKIIAQRAKLLGLESLPAAVATQQTVVVAGTSEEYVAALRLVVGNTPALPASDGEAG